MKKLIIPILIIGLIVFMIIGLIVFMIIDGHIVQEKAIERFYSNCMFTAKQTYVGGCEMDWGNSTYGNYKDAVCYCKDGNKYIWKARKRGYMKGFYYFR